MPTVTLSSKNQITLPVSMLRDMGLQAGAKLVVELVDGRIMLLPEPTSWVDYLAGSMKGVYGETKEEVARYIAEARNGWEIDGLRKALAGDDGLRRVYGALDHERGCTAVDIGKALGTDWRDALHKLDTLVELHAAEWSHNPERPAEGLFRRTA